MATFITGIHHCPDCQQPHTGSRAFEELNKDGTVLTDWCGFQCANGHVWARPGYQAAK